MATYYVYWTHDSSGTHNQEIIEASSQKQARAKFHQLLESRGTPIHKARDVDIRRLTKAKIRFVD